MLEYLQKVHAIEVVEDSVGDRQDFVILGVNKNLVIQLARENINQKPQKMPEIAKKNELSTEIRKRNITQKKDNFDFILENHAIQGLNAIQP